MVEMRPNLGPAEILLRCVADRGPKTGDRGLQTEDRRPEIGDQEPETSNEKPGADWNEVVDLAIREHVDPLLYRRLKEADARDCVPADVWKRLRRAYFTSGDRNARLFRELRAVLERLHGSGIPVIVLKGAYLAEAVYGDVALRRMCDSDLLVPQADLARAEAVLLGMGGAQHRPSRNRIGSSPPRHRDPDEVRSQKPDVRMQKSGVRSLGDLGGSSPVAQQPLDMDSDCRTTKHALPVFIGELAVELHWTIVSPTGPVRVDAAGFWNRARPALVAGVKVLSLSPEDLLLHLCLHFCYENGCVGLRYLCDIAETLRHFGSGLDWPQVVERAREWGATRHAGLALRLAGDRLDAAVPDDILKRLVPGGIDQRVLAAADEALLTQTARHHWESLFRAQGARSTGEKARFLKERVFLSRDEMAAKYPASRGSRFFYFYYALRLRDGLRAYSFHALRRARLMMQKRRRERHAALYNWLTRP